VYEVSVCLTCSSYIGVSYERDADHTLVVSKEQASDCSECCAHGDIGISEETAETWYESQSFSSVMYTWSVLFVTEGTYQRVHMALVSPALVY
jgi:hypothetical protein